MSCVGGAGAGANVGGTDEGEGTPKAVVGANGAAFGSSGFVVGWAEAGGATKRSFGYFTSMRYSLTHLRRH